MHEEVQTSRNLLAQLTILIAELEAFADPEETKEQIETKEDHVRVMKDKRMMIRAGLGFFCVVLYGLCLFSLLFSNVVVFAFIVRVYHPAPMVLGIVCGCYCLEFGEDVAESPSLGDKMKYVFGCSRSKDKSLGRLMRNLCSALRVLVSYKQRLVAKLEALGEVEGAAKSLEYMRAIVGRDAVTLGELKHCGHCEAEFIGELESFGVRHVPAKPMEFLKEIQLKDRENMAQMHLLEREIELNASKKELFIKKLDHLVSY
uniref:Uncharacterized protein n=1 Tax=Tanacetum cinerariifolium TaxID=118510 RepID=A0A6L2NEF3_TANCI|nr:hypothetical protein [Tanacetum cinerariifolium]